MHSRKNFFTLDRNKDIYPEPPKNLVDFVKKFPNYADFATYAKHLESSWLKEFDASCFKIVFFEELTRNHRKVLRELQEFIGVKHMELPEISSGKNKKLRFKFLYKIQSKVAKQEKLKRIILKSKLFGYVYENLLASKSSSLSKKERAYLKSIFSSDVARLKEILKVDVPWKDFN